MRTTKKWSVMSWSLAAGLLMSGSFAWAAETTYTSNPILGNSTFSAVFDAVIGERITAVSSAIECTITVEAGQKSGGAKCSVPLTSIMVDSEPTKTEHFQEWATNKKTEAKQCRFDLEIPNVTVDTALEDKKPVEFSSEGTFTICGRKREGEKPEKITGSVIYLPPGTYGKNRTLRVRAKIEGFNREEYGISPAQTQGWLARVQQLAPVVAAEGTIEVTVFAIAPAEETAEQKNE